MKRVAYIIKMFVFLLMLSGVGRFAFFYYNRTTFFFTLRDMAKAELYGLPMDLVVASGIMLLPYVFVLLSFLWKKMPLRVLLAPYLLITLVLATAITGSDVTMYEHWKFKLDASVISYMSEPGEGAACATVWYIVSRIGSIVLSAILAVVVAIWMTPARFCQKKSRKAERHTKATVYGTLCCGMVIFTLLTLASLNIVAEKNAFQGQKIYLSHGAVNPVYHMAASLWQYSKPSAEQFVYMNENEAKGIVQPLFPAETEDITDTLLTTTRPNILTIQLESFGAVFVEKLGGIPDISPELCAWMEHGVNFTNAWATSFRTDRGTVSVMAGYPSYPTKSLMLIDSCFASLPAFAKTLQGAGYRTTYLYGGEPSLMNKGKYLKAAGFEDVLGIEDIGVNKSERDAWGANDSISFNRLMSYLKDREKSPWYVGYQTLSSHQPFDVPYQRLDNKVTNAFAYTDHCLGMFLDSLSKTPLWDNLLVVIFADHGLPYKQNFDDPEFFHMPLLFVGGAVKKNIEVNKLIAQNDIAATILSQMNISHRNYRWSRNVFSRNYTSPCIYATYPAGALFMDETGSTMIDLQSDAVVCDDPQISDLRLKKLKALLQETYAE